MADIFDSPVPFFFFCKEIWALQILPFT